MLHLGQDFQYLHLTFSASFLTNEQHVKVDLMTEQLVAWLVGCSFTLSFFTLTLFLLLVSLSHAGQQLDGVLGPQPHCPVQLLLQHVVVVTLGGAHHLPYIGDKLLSLDKLNPSIHLKYSLYLN